MRYLLARLAAFGAILLVLLQLLGSANAAAAIHAPAHRLPAITATQLASYRPLHPKLPQRWAYIRLDLERVVKPWANVRSVPTTAHNQPVGHLVWGNEFKAYRHAVYGQAPYGSGSSHQWLEIASGPYAGRYIWAGGIVDPRSGYHAFRSARATASTARVIHRGRYHLHRRTHLAYVYHGWLGGTLGCNGLEALWRAAGGPSWNAELAASIAMAESSGRQFATGPAGERGYWQIHPDHGPTLSTYNPYGNARAAVIISGYGRNWSAWTTYTTGRYRGLC